MFTDTALRRLWWKELRQLLPLVIMLPILMLVLMGVSAVVSATSVPGWATRLQAFAQMLFLGMPCLFAVGVGGIAVAQEKETRTLAWLSSLPIGSRQIVRTKLMAGLSGLAVLWIICASIAFVNNLALTPQDRWIVPLDLVFWVGYSVYILLMGLALAWYFSSPVVGLITLVPAAALPFMTWGVAHNVLSFMTWGVAHNVLYGSRGPSDGITLLESTILLAFIVVAGWLQWYFGQRCLRPALAHGLRGQSDAHPRIFGGYRTPDAAAGYGQPRTPTASLLWQFTMQNRLVLASCAAMAIVATMMAVWPVAFEVSRRGGTRQFWDSLMLAPLAMILGWLATSWLGVLVFQGDTIGHRIRFLADRGVSPRLTWLTRHAVSLTLLVVLYAIAATSLTIALSRTSGQRVDAGDLLQLLFACFILPLYCYTVSQWVGQMVGTPIMAAIVAPVVALITVGFIGFAFFSLEAPWYLLVLVSLLPLLATFVLTSRWMERRLDRYFWGGHIAGAAVFLLLPVIPVLLTWLFEPGMPKTTERELAALSQQAGLDQPRLQELVFGSQEAQSPGYSYMGEDDEGLMGAGYEGQTIDDAASLPPEENADEQPDDSPRNLLNHHDQAVDNIADQLSGTPRRPIHASSLRAIEFLRGYAMYARLRIDSPEEATEHRDRYRRSLGLLTDIAARLRTSHRLLEQDYADRVEIWLLAEALQPQAKPTMGAELYTTLVSQLGDREARRESRQRAVALSWAIYAPKKSSDFGGYDFGYRRHSTVGLRTSLKLRRRLGASLQDLWHLAKARPEADSPATLQRIAAAWGYAPAEYGLREGSGFFRAEEARMRAYQPLVERTVAIASQWNAGWEQQAFQLYQELLQSEEPQHVGSP